MRDIVESRLAPYIGIKSRDSGVEVLLCPTDYMLSRPGTPPNTYPFSYTVNMYIFKRNATCLKWSGKGRRR